MKLTGSTAFGCILIILSGVLSSCKKSAGYYLPTTFVSSVIQLNVNNSSYSLASAPDVISFTTQPIISSLPNSRQYVIKGTSSSGALTFTLNFHTDTVGGRYYYMDGSQMLVNSKTYISTAKKSTDKITVNILDINDKLYKGTFSFYSFNKATPTDSVLVTGVYNIQE